MQLKIKKLHPDAIIPRYQTDGAACFDLHACLPKGIDANAIYPGDKGHIRTGLAFEVPEGYALMIYSRSGHGFKNSIRLVNAVGVLDSDFRGEAVVGLHNDGDETFVLYRGDRIAQAMLVQVPRVEFVEVEELSDTARGVGGFGSTGA